MPDYKVILSDLKEKIRQARLQAAMTINRQLLTIYWEIGNTILDQQKNEGWGTKVIDRLSRDLKIDFPEMKGLSLRNLKYMRAFTEAYPYFVEHPLQNTNEIDHQEDKLMQVSLAQNSKTGDSTIVQAELAQLSWYHHITLLDKIKDPLMRVFYIRQTISNGWSRDVMVHQIESGLYQRQGNISSNFHSTIAPAQSELVRQIFKDPYKFDFIYLGQEIKERDLEEALTNQITKFLLELGQWFAFMGKQYRVLLGDKEYFFDLLFYHTRLKRYIIIELKIDDFKPEYKGKMDFYLQLADEMLKQNDDENSIGLILCKTKDGLVAEYALRDSRKPIGIAEYTINKKLPLTIRRELPSIEELESVMGKNSSNKE
jgi:predicted nuclease of restriction endonuclease-like (RecB) superfamily